MLALAAAVLFAIALIFQLLVVSLGTIDAYSLVTAGLLCVALHMAGIGTSRSWRPRRRRR